jgi:hypothetical protein
MWHLDDVLPGQSLYFDSLLRSDRAKLAQVVPNVETMMLDQNRFQTLHWHEYQLRAPSCTGSTNEDCVYYANMFHELILKLPVDEFDSHNLYSRCIVGDLNSTNTLFLVGDSHALAWMDAFHHIGVRLNLRVHFLGSSGCNPFLAIELAQHPRGKNCASFLPVAHAILKHYRPSYVVGTWFFDESIARVQEDVWQSAVQQFLSMLSEMNSQFIMLAGICIC